MGLTITSQNDTRASTLIGRLYQAQKLDDETIFPGIPVFQKPPFESPQDGEMILCSALRLGFSSKLARGIYIPPFSFPRFPTSHLFRIELLMPFVDNTRKFLVNKYNAKPSY